MADILFIMGTARGDRNTRKMVDAVLNHLPEARFLDLSELTIAPYEYEEQYDDFEIAAKAIEEAKTIIFATPIYWYSMSGLMKNFFDRMTDLTDQYKSIGKGMKGKTMFGIFAGGDLPEYFVPVFSDTANYFDMNWGGYWVVENIPDGTLPAEALLEAREFAKQIKV